MEQNQTINYSSSPKHVFLHLLMIVMLYVCVIAAITLYFQYINQLFFDTAFSQRTSIYNGIRWASAALIVAYPVLVYLSWLINKELQHNAELRHMKTRRWLLYFTQFITALTIIIDLIVLIYEFYGGEITSRFIFKTLVILVIAAVVLGYYRWELHRPETPSVFPKIVAGAAGVILLISLGSGFLIAGTPAQQRAVRLDEQRIYDLAELQNAVLSFTQAKGHLPPDTAALSGWYSTLPTDPASQAPYSYEPLSATTFKICATFSAKQMDDLTKAYYPVTEPVKTAAYIMDGNNWQHPAGDYCFERTVELPAGV